MVGNQKCSSIQIRFVRKSGFGKLAIYLKITNFSGFRYSAISMSDFTEINADKHISKALKS